MVDWAQSLEVKTTEEGADRALHGKCPEKTWEEAEDDHQNAKLRLEYFLPFYDKQKRHRDELVAKLERAQQSQSPDDWTAYGDLLHFLRGSPLEETIMKVWRGTDKEEAAIRELKNVAKDAKKHMEFFDAKLGKVLQWMTVSVDSDLQGIVRDEKSYKLDNGHSRSKSTIIGAIRDRIIEDLSASPETSRIEILAELEDLLPITTLLQLKSGLQVVEQVRQRLHSHVELFGGESPAADAAFKTAIASRIIMGANEVSDIRTVLKMMAPSTKWREYRQKALQQLLQELPANRENVKHANRAQQLEQANAAQPTVPAFPRSPIRREQSPIRKANFSPREPDRKCYEWSAKSTCMRGDSCKFRHGENDRRSGFAKSPSRERPNAGAGTTPRGGLSWGGPK